jgi:hypothetical protein
VMQLVGAWIRFDSTLYSTSSHGSCDGGGQGAAAAMLSHIRHANAAA